MKYKVGDEVVLLDYIVNGTNCDYIISGLVKHLGETHTIAGTDFENRIYEIKKDGIYHCINDEMIDHEKTAELKKEGKIMKYKKGQEVILRDDLEDGKQYGGESFVVGYAKVQGMETILGKSVTIQEIISNSYIVKGKMNWHITDSMIDHQKTLEINKEISVGGFLDEVEDLIDEYANIGEPIFTVTTHVTTQESRVTIDLNMRPTSSLQDFMIEED